MSRRSMLQIAAAMLLAGGVATPAAAQRDAGLAHRVQELLVTYDQHTSIPVPVLAGSDMEDLLGGDVVKLRRQLDEEATNERKSVVSYFLTELPRDQLWIAALDPHHLADDRLLEVRLEHGAHGNATWHQYFDLPWPVTDRHWVIDIEKGVELAAATAGTIWEHRWALTDGGEEIAQKIAAEGEAGDLSAKDLEKAVYLPANTGAWMMGLVDDRHTLIVYHVTAVFGGAIPDSWVATFAYPKLEELLRGVVALAPEMPAHYDKDHEPIIGGDGKPVLPMRNR